MVEWRNVWVQLGRSGVLAFAASLALTKALTHYLYTEGPYVRPVFEGDPSHWFKHHEDTVSPWQMDFVFLVVYTPVIFALEMFTGFVTGAYAERLVAGLRYSLGLFGSVLLTDCAVVVGKMTVGWLRPDFGDRCFGVDTLPPEVDNFTDLIQGNDQCTAPAVNDAFLDSGRRSFPSGHAGNAMSGCFFLVLYLAAACQRFRSIALKQMFFFVALISLTYGIFVGVSRIFDNRHFPADVAGGMLVGCAVATVYFLACLSMEDDGRAPAGGWTTMAWTGRSTNSEGYSFEEIPAVEIEPAGTNKGRSVALT